MDNNTPLADYDAQWKKIIEYFPEHTLQRLFPDLAEQRDFSKPITFLDKEFQKIFADWEKKGWTLVDKLLLVPLKNGKAKLVLIHIDVHRSHDAHFKKLMWRRGYRIMDKYPEYDFTAIAVYIGAQVPPEPDRFLYQFSGTEFLYKFNTLIVKNQSEEALLASSNPLDIAVLSMLYIIKAGNQNNLLKRYKVQLARLCFQKGYTNEETRKLLIFVAYTIALPPEDELNFKNEIKPLMEEKRIPLAELNPIVTEMFEVDFYGKTLKERDAQRDAERDAQRDAERDAENVIRLFQAGIDSEKIAEGLNMKLSFVQKIISDFKDSND
ncbi:MAG: hypothetical protein AAF573_14870 [Bacteroidota bacterium]